MICKRHVISFLFFFVLINANAQFVNFGTDPSNYKWNIITTDHYKLIFPVGTDSMAYRYARLLETYHPYVQHTIGYSKKKNFPVVIHPGNMLSNGMVAWAPRRMELITTPGSDLYAQAWDRQLVVHESRHVFQTRKLLHGVFNPLYYILGEQTAGVSSFFVPTWFFEGDAVATETALSGSGRGRLPEFNMIYRAQYATGDFYSFDKWFLGSYKNYTGTKYALGYDMTAYARSKYGADIWEKVTESYIKRIFSIPPFGNSIKRNTGVTKEELFKNTFDFLNEEWEELEIKYRESSFRPRYLTPSRDIYTTYKYPQAIDNETVIALKSSLDDISSLVMVKNNKEENLTYLGNINSKIIYNNGRIYWTEYIPGLRWSHQNYSDLKYYDLENGKIKTITKRQRFQSPAIRKDGQVAAVSEFSLNGENTIFIVDLESGKKVGNYAVPFNAFAKDLVYTDNDDLIVSTISDNGITLWQLTIKDGSWKLILSPTKANISSLYWGNNELLFESGIDGTNNIYSLNVESLKSYQVTTARFGAFTPSLTPDKKQLMFSDYQADGYRLATVPADKKIDKPVNLKNPYQFKLAEIINKQEGIDVDTLPLKDIHFNPKPYNKALHLFKIHSWTPFYYDVNDLINMNVDDFTTVIKPGAMFLSQNSLNTAITQLGYFYRHGNHHGKLSFTYMGFYPVFEINVDYGGDAFNLQWKDNEQGNKSIQVIRPNRTLINAETRIYIPFNLTRNDYIRGFQPILTYYFTNNKYEQYYSGKLNNFQYLLPELRFYNYRRMSTRDILPKWGYQFRLQHLSMIENKENYGKLYAARLTTYLPGIITNNSLMIRTGYQYQSIDNKTLYIPKKLLNQPRGLSYIYSTQHQIELKADYGFSFANPDWSLWSILYIKRLRSNLFYDININKAGKNAGWENHSTTGADLIFDFNAIQAEFPISAGVRLIKPIQESGIKAELLFSISF